MVMHEKLCGAVVCAERVVNLSRIGSHSSVGLDCRNGQVIRSAPRERQPWVRSLLLPWIFVQF